MRSRIEPNVTVECPTCGHTGVLTREALSHFSIQPNTPIAAFVKRLRCRRCGSQSKACWRPGSRGSRKRREVHHNKTDTRSLELGCKSSESGRERSIGRRAPAAVTKAIGHTMVDVVSHLSPQ
jgi:hypothetical protein